MENWRPTLESPTIPPSFYSGLERICIDASSMIYHLKTGLLGSLAAEIELVSTPQVIAEVGWPHLPVRPFDLNLKEDEDLTNDESLLLLARRENLPVLSEDKEILESCRKEGREHYNTLMMLNFLLLRRRIKRDEYPEYLKRLKDCAHYSERVLEYGQKLSLEILEDLSSSPLGERENRTLTDEKVRSSGNLFPGKSLVSHKERCRLLGNRPLTLWFTGLSASGKSTIAYAMERHLTDKGIPCYVLDGDSLRQGLNRDLGFSAADRSENIRRVAETARLLNDAGLTVISAFISPFEADRAAARNIVGTRYFREIYISTSIDVCRSRDPKGLYRRAMAGEIPDFTGIDSPYEAPVNPDFSVDTGCDSLPFIIDKLMTLFL